CLTSLHHQMKLTPAIFPATEVSEGACGASRRTGLWHSDRKPLQLTGQLNCFPCPEGLPL
ncbi:hypothetical protein NDU88_000216, partial [Pleurodeles waltl]